MANSGDDDCPMGTLRRFARRSAFDDETNCAHRPRPWTATRERSFVRSLCVYLPTRAAATTATAVYRYIATGGELDIRHRVVAAFRDKNNNISLKKYTVHVAASAMEAIGHKLFQLGDPEGKGFIVRRDMQVSKYIVEYNRI